MQLVFVHVPKTAGFALHATLEEVFGALNTLQINDDDKLRFLRNSPPERFARYNYISGHFDFTDIAAKCRPDAVFISILRDPIARNFPNTTTCSALPVTRITTACGGNP